MTISSTTKWIGLALLGLLISVGVAVAATKLTSQQIGIASESVSAGDSLAPAVNSAANGPGGQDATPTTTAPPDTGDSDDDDDGGDTTTDDEFDDDLDGESGSDDDGDSGSADSGSDDSGSDDSGSDDRGGSGSDD